MVVHCVAPGPELDVHLAERRLELRDLGEQAAFPLAALTDSAFESLGSGADELALPVADRLFRDPDTAGCLRHGQVAGQNGQDELRLLFWRYYGWSGHVEISPPVCVVVIKSCPLVVAADPTTRRVRHILFTFPLRLQVH